MKIFFGWTQNAAVSYYRFIQFAKYMRRKNGIDVAYSKYTTNDAEIINWQNDLKNTLVTKQLEMLLGSTDISVFGFFSNPMALAMIGAAKELYKKPILMEIDDYVFGLPASNVAFNSYKPGSDGEWIIKKQLEMSDGLIVSTNTLKEQYKAFNKNIFVIKNGVDLEVFDKVKFKTSKTIKTNKTRILFAGSPNHGGDLKLIKPVILEILAERTDIEFVFVGCVPDFKHERVICDDSWVMVDKFPQKIADLGCDIALAPLRDNAFNRGKSNLRWLEMSMLKMPVVASNMNAYRESIVDGKTGLLCSDSNEWKSAILSLVDNKILRKNVAVNAYNEVRKNYSCQDIASEYIKVLKAVKNGQAGNKR